MTRRFVSFQEDPEVVKRIDVMAREQGSDRSAFIRGAIREKLKREVSPNE